MATLTVLSSLLILLLTHNGGAQITDEDIRVISSQIWAADSNRITGSDVQYNVNGAKLFTYVNEARLTATSYRAFIAMLNNYNPETGVAETCSPNPGDCIVEQEAFLDAVLATQPLQLLHPWLAARGLTSSLVSEFRNDLRQYWFMKYSRTDGPLDSSGFEHVFVGEIHRGAVSGLQNWVQFYEEEQASSAVYGPYQRTCNPEIVTSGLRWLGYTKTSGSMFIRTSPEVEVALYTLCLLAKMGTSCPVRLDGTELTITAMEMTGVSGLPKTIGYAYPNC